MHLTPQEGHVVAKLQRVRVAQFGQLAAQLQLSTKTIQRALIKAGYFASINRNGCYVTLRDIPQFNEWGLWSVDQIHFSKHGNLRDTLVTLIEQASSGRTLQELENHVGTRVHNHLSHLVREGKVGRFLWNRHAVYVSARARQASQQEAHRRAVAPSTSSVVATTPSSLSLPTGLDAMTVIQVLVKQLETPSASPASAARSLRTRHVSIRADQVRDILDFYGLKKNDTLKLSELLNQLRGRCEQQLHAAQVPDGVAHRFDGADAGSAVQKTTRRQVVTLKLAGFQAVEVARKTLVGHPLASPLNNLVPKGGTYGYDVIAHVGCETFLRGRKLEDVALELPRTIPFSSLYDLQHKFLFYLGHLHRQSASKIRDHFQQQGGSSWLIDATIEPDTPMYFGVYSSTDDILLDAWKIPTENADFITPCLRQAAAQFGRPIEVMHDLSEAMHTACDQGLGDVPQRVCHFHFLHDIGEDLLSKIQARVRERVRQLKLQPRLKEQRNGQTEWFRQHIEDPRMLCEALRTGLQNAPSETLGHEVLIAFHQWILDYAHDGHRQGFPFDPYLLYFHRRVVRASAAVDYLLNDDLVRRQTPQVLANFARLLRQYLSDPQIIDATAQYEKAFAVFSRLRSELRLTAQGDSPARDRYCVDKIQIAEMHESLATLRDEYRQKAQEETDASLQRCLRIIVEHLDRYWDYLFPSADATSVNRTTNRLESCSGASKRRCRQRHGRKKLSRDFQSLPAEFMLVGNLENPIYVQIVLGEMSSLISKLAEAGRSAGPWTHWRLQYCPLKIGRLPRRFIRTDNFIDKLIGIYDNVRDGNALQRHLVPEASKSRANRNSER